jgi:hypothetical protein
MRPRAFFMALRRFGGAAFLVWAMPAVRCGAVRCGSLRVGGVAEEAVAGLDLAARGGGACLVGPAVAVGCGLRPTRDCAALLGLGARRQTHCATLRSDRRAESVYEVRCAHRPQPCAAYMDACRVAREVFEVLNRRINCGLISGL